MKPITNFHPHEPPMTVQFAKMQEFLADAAACGMQGVNASNFARMKLREWVREQEDIGDQPLLTPPAKKPKPEPKPDAASVKSAVQAMAKRAEVARGEPRPAFDESEAPEEEPWHPGMDLPF